MLAGIACCAFILARQCLQTVYWETWPLAAFYIIMHIYMRYILSNIIYHIILARLCLQTIHWETWPLAVLYMERLCCWALRATQTSFTILVVIWMIISMFLINVINMTNQYDQNLHNMYKSWYWGFFYKSVKIFKICLIWWLPNFYIFFNMYDLKSVSCKIFKMCMIWCLTIF